MRTTLLVGLLLLSGCITKDSRGSLRAEGHKGATEATGTEKGWVKVEFVNDTSEPLNFFIDDRMQLEVNSRSRGVCQCLMGKRTFMAVAPSGNHISETYRIGKTGLIWTVTD